MDGERQTNLAEQAAEAEEMARFLKAIANPARLRILSLLVDEARQVGELESELGLSQAYVSQQLARLRDAGLVKGERHGRAVRYTVVDARLQPVIEVLHRFQAARRRDGVGKF